MTPNQRRDMEAHKEALKRFGGKMPLSNVPPKRRKKTPALPWKVHYALTNRIDAQGRGSRIHQTMYEKR